MDLHLKISGVLLLFLAGIHVFFPAHFNWKDEFRAVSLINRQMMYVHTFFIGLILVLMGLLCLTSAEELQQSILGKRVALGAGIFWTARLGIQFFGYSRELWQNKPRETAIHILFSFLWAYLSFVFLRVFWS